MTKEVVEKIIKGITDKIECNTVDIDDWAEFWGFTREEYEEFLDMSIKASEQEPKTGHWILKHRTHNEIKHYTGHDEMGETHTISVLERYEVDEPYCSECGKLAGDTSQNYCCACGAKMEVEE